MMSHFVLLIKHFMISKTFNRYIWLLNILLQRKKLTLEEICEEWNKSYLGDNTPLSKRTFHQHRNAIEELFDVSIKCDTSNGYRYYISNPEVIQWNKTRKWLLNSFSLSNMITAGHNMKDRILFENIPGGIEYLQTVIESIQRGNVMEVDYQPFGSTRRVYHLEGYAMKVYNQRWYIVGKIQEQDAIRHLALDRILELQITEKKYTIPKSFDAKKYYANTIGIFVNDELKPQKVCIRVYGIQVDYLRTLPLHHTQKEVVCKHGAYSEFHYNLCLTPELSTQLLGMGENVEVLEPLELREMMKKRLEECLTKYK